MGFQSQDQVRVQMQRARLLVLPSLEEGQGVVLLEALACGTPVVASGVDGIPEVVTDEVGVLVPPADPEALCEAILSILARPEQWDAMSRSARERAVEHYDWARLADQYVMAYESLARRRRGD
jgi:glycosyltransferase involved in cell wall biosynthesis